MELALSYLWDGFENYVGTVEVNLADLVGFLWCLVADETDVAAVGSYIPPKPAKTLGFRLWV